MDWGVIGAVSEVVGAAAVVVTLAYLATQVRQSTAQQRREEIIAIQRGQNELLAQIADPVVFRSIAMVMDDRRAAKLEDQVRALVWLVQYLNNFQIIYDLHQMGSLSEARYRIWEGTVLSFLATKGFRDWWEDEKMTAFMPELVSRLDNKLNDPDNPPIPMDEINYGYKASYWRT